MPLRLLAILILLLQPWLASVTRAHSASTLLPQSGEAVSCCGGDCTCCAESGSCPCAVQAPASPIEPPTAPTSTTPTAPLRFTLPPSNFLFALPDPALTPSAPRVIAFDHHSIDSHTRALARLCVWRT